MNDLLIVNWYYLMELKQSSLVAIGVVGLAVGVAYLFSSKTKDRRECAPAEVEEDDLEAINIERQDLEKSRELLLSLSSHVNIQFTQDKLLTKRSLIDFIIQAVQSVTEKQVNEFYSNNRKARRPHLALLTNEDSEKYFKCVCYFDNDIEYMISKSHKDLAAFVNIDENIIEESLDYYLERDHAFKNQLMTVTVQLRKALKKKLKPSRVSSIETSKLIIEREIQVLTDDGEKLIDTINGLGLAYQDQQFIPSFIYLYLSDVIEKEFGLEEQDYAIYRNQLIAADNGRQLFRRLEAAQNHLIKEIQNIFNQ